MCRDVASAVCPDHGLCDPQWSRSSGTQEGGEFRTKVEGLTKNDQIILNKMWPKKNMPGFVKKSPNNSHAVFHIMG